MSGGKSFYFPLLLFCVSTLLYIVPKWLEDKGLIGFAPFWTEYLMALFFALAIICAYRLVKPPSKQKEQEHEALQRRTVQLMARIERRLNRLEKQENINKAKVGKTAQRIRQPKSASKRA